MVRERIKRIAKRIEKRITAKADKPIKLSPDIQRWLSTEFGKEQGWAEYMYKTGQHEALTRHGSNQDKLSRR
jgi:hypothetical protein